MNTRFKPMVCQAIWTLYGLFGVLIIVIVLACLLDGYYVGTYPTGRMYDYGVLVWVFWIGLTSLALVLLGKALHHLLRRSSRRQ